MDSKSRAVNKNPSVLMQPERGKRAKSICYEVFDSISKKFLFFMNVQHDSPTIELKIEWPIATLTGFTIWQKVEKYFETKSSIRP